MMLYLGLTPVRYGNGNGEDPWVPKSGAMQALSGHVRRAGYLAEIVDRSAIANGPAGKCPEVDWHARSAIPDSSVKRFTRVTRFTRKHSAPINPKAPAMLASQSLEKDLSSARAPVKTFVLATGVDAEADNLVAIVNGLARRVIIASDRRNLNHSAGLLPEEGDEEAIGVTRSARDMGVIVDGVADT